MSSGAGLGQVHLLMERDRVSLPRDSVVSWATPGLCGKLLAGVVAGPWDLPHF